MYDLKLTEQLVDLNKNKIQAKYEIKSILNFNISTLSMIPELNYEC